MGWLVASVEVAGPMLDAKLEFGLVREVVLLATSIYGMAAIIIFTLDMAAAGMLNLLAVATIGCTMAMLLVGRDALLVLDLLLHVVNRVRRLDVEGDGLAG